MKLPWDGLAFIIQEGTVLLLRQGGHHAKHPLHTLRRINVRLVVGNTQDAAGKKAYECKASIEPKSEEMLTTAALLMDIPGIPLAFTASRSSVLTVYLSLSQMGAVLRIKPVALWDPGAALPAVTLTGYQREGVWSDQALSSCLSERLNRVSLCWLILSAALPAPPLAPLEPRPPFLLSRRAHCMLFLLSSGWSEEWEEVVTGSEEVELRVKHPVQRALD
ncbi:hypothetical protein FQN60_003903 [Etheostoma spectabile]|uniref:Uncharacterized protein n=1 Tax=Etheostoma spectabile TaxID=54343 RepID=A0A5J5CVP0_9PERO|nr:hypothetical protein FQN60_003903 [Etheostoma spectabile]